MLKIKKNKNNNDRHHHHHHNVDRSMELSLARVYATWCDTAPDMHSCLIVNGRRIRNLANEIISVAVIMERVRIGLII